MDSNTITPLIQQYTVDFASNNNFLFVKGIQGDGYSTRYVDISLVNNGYPYEIDTVAVTVVIRGTKPDGKIIFNECEIINNNTIRVEITQQMSSTAGKGDYEISIMSNTENRTLTSFPFFIMISKSSFDIGYVVSSDEFGLLVEKINETNRLISEMTVLKEETTEATNECREITSIATEVVEEAKESISTIQELNTTITDEEEIRKANESARVLNEEERQNQEQIRQEKMETIDELIEEATVITENASVSLKEIEQATKDAKTATEEANKAAYDATASVELVNEASDNANEAAYRANTISEDLEEKVANGYFNGKDGIITTVEINQIAFQVVGDDLILTYEEGSADAEKFSIDEDGYLIYTIE